MTVTTAPSAKVGKKSGAENFSRTIKELLWSFVGQMSTAVIVTDFICL